MNKLFNYLAALVLLFILAACAPQPPVPEDNFYRLPGAKLTTGHKQLFDEIAVKRFDTDGLHSERALLYSDAEQPLQLHQYHYHHWVDSPPRLLQEHIISALRSAGIAAAVTNYDPANRRSVRLGGKIRSFEHIKSGNSATVVIDLELRMDDTKGMPLVLKDYHIKLAAKSAQPHDLVTAYGQALTTIYEQFVTELANRP